MSTYSTQTPVASGLGGALARIGSAIWAQMVLLGEARARAALATDLMSRSDDDLAAIGLKREDIAKTVWSVRFDR